MIYSGRFTIRDTVDNRTFRVTVSNVRPGDSDIYYCGIERNLGDNRHMVTVRVLPGLCRKAPPWTDIVHFPPNVTEIEVGHVVEVTCQETYQEKNITLRCREGSGGFVLSGRSDSDYCVGVCRESPPWTDMVDFPENFTEIVVNGSVVVSCQQRYEEKTLRLQCREEASGFLLSPEEGQGSCVARISRWRFLLTKTFGFVVPFVLKLVVLLLMLVVKTSCSIKQKLYRTELIQERSLEESHISVQQREQNTYIPPPPPTAPAPSHRKKEEPYEMSPRREEEEVEEKIQEIYENLQDEVYKSPVRNEKPKMPRKH